MNLRPVTSTLFPREAGPSTMTRVTWMAWVSSLEAIVLHLVLVLQSLDLLPQHLDGDDEDGDHDDGGGYGGDYGVDDGDHDDGDEDGDEFPCTAP